MKLDVRVVVEQLERPGTTRSAKHTSHAVHASAPSKVATSSVRAVRALTPLAEIYRRETNWNHSHEKEPNKIFNEMSAKQIKTIWIREQKNP